MQRDGREFTVDGEPFRFVGFNLYDAAASDRYSCRPASRIPPEDLQAQFRWLHDEAGVTVIRFWAYQTYTASGRDFSAVDAVLAAARATGIRVIPVLEDGPGDCSTGEPGVPLSEADQGAWFTQGYREPYGSARLSFREYAEVMARHYRDEPTIVAWMLVNEAETTARDERGRSVLVSFAGDVAGLVHSVDPNHLVTLGTQGNGAPGASGADLREVYNQSDLDFVEVHDWARYGSDTEAMPGAGSDGTLPAVDSSTCRSRTAPVACSFAIAEELGKPIVVGEAGISADDAGGRGRRAELLRAKAEAAFAAGASGYLVWHYSTAETDGYDVVRADRDPLFDVTARLARGFAGE
ncbi:cellulase (glycosyl hydrolase family 5) [Kineococcus rhizosphaerae]|uniref:mannan endo-1,4-beta-mannosidase n=1 Tax=Kineococcus rhizosphaerae TaxID=559628 RepID=A0A2T0R5D5_9ACTN|nr:cellulase (glycosyl hydrolase family 5) [Kineococcus rhizosphaerae]